MIFYTKKKKMKKENEYPKMRNQIDFTQKYNNAS